MLNVSSSSSNDPTVRPASVTVFISNWWREKYLKYIIIIIAHGMGR